jgi:hypothetical protein
MSKLAGLAIALALLLFGCAAANPDRNSAQVAENSQACNTTDTASLKQEMAANKIGLVADLEGEPLDALKKWLEPFTQKKPVPAESDRVLIFLNETKTMAMLTWFKGDCLLAYNMGPWRPLSEFLGQPI